MRVVVSLLTTLLFVTSAVAQDVSSATKSTPVKGPFSPEESLKHFVLADDNLQIEIVAAEPEVIDPVAIQFDEHGRLWVVELSDYPNGPEPGKPPLSRIKLLEDKDGDGRYETAHIFADKLLFATGVQPWDGGVIVTLAGEVAYFKDTDGDHKADLRETWFTGFAQANPQLRANHPTFGPDGWIYVANGLRGGNVIAVKKDWPVKARREGEAPAEPRSKDHPPSAARQEPRPPGASHDPANPQPVSLTGRDFKFDPLTGRYEAISGNGQFGMTFDAWGNRFVCDNRHPCRHVIFEEDFIRRCPHVAFPAVVHDVIPPDDKNKVFPLTSAWTTSNLHAGTFTASCGVTVYTGDWLPEEFRGNVFVCEPTGNLVQRAILEPDGVTFKSRNPYQSRPDAPRQEKQNAPLTPENQSASNANQAVLSRSDRSTEFLASRDDWFRPVDLQNGPDGALYVVDMYRAVIEHPEWVPDELKKRPDTWLGNDKGRIYRIRPRSPVVPRQEQPNARSTSEKQSTSTARSADLSRSDRSTLGKPPVSVENLDASFNSPNGWHRTTTVRLLHEGLMHSRPITAIEARSAEAKFLALHSKTLRQRTAGASTLECLVSQDAQLREEAVRLLTTITEGDEQTARARQHLAMILAHDKTPRVLFRAVQGIRLEDEVGDELSAPLAHLGLSETTDSWLRAAIIGSLETEPPVAFEIAIIELWQNMTYKKKAKPITSGQIRFIATLAEQVARHGGRNKSWHFVDNNVIALTGDDIRANVELSIEGILGLERGLSGTGKSLINSDWLTSGAQKGLAKLIQRAIEIIDRGEDVSSNSTDTFAALRLVRLTSYLNAGSVLKRLAESDADQSMRLAAIESFASFRQPEVDAWLIERYRSETPAIRRAILAALFASKERQLRLLEAIEQGQIAATELDPVRVNQLTQAKDETLRERAKKILAAAAPASRKEVLDAYQSALSLKGDPQRGKAVFVKNCSTCHRVDNVGVNVAPDISDTRTKKPEQLLMDILDPNKAIDANYFAYAVVTKEGKTESGVISSESSNSITLKQPEGKVLTLLRSDIEELRNTGLSLMPVGVEKNIDQQALADLIFWLKNWRYLDGKVPATSIEPK